MSKRILRTCKHCGVRKPLEDFYAWSNGKRHRGCKPCTLRKQREYYESRKEQKQEIRRRNHLKRKYGLSPEDYEAMRSQTAGACQICGKPQKKLLVDHDHATGRVRGLLCKTCNWGLGQFYDSPELLMKAVDYLDAL